MRERHSELEFCGEYEGFILSVWVEDDKPVRFSRNNNRWRVIGWHYCKSGVVAESLFDITDEIGCCKVSDAEWKKAVGYVEDMASTLDAAAMSFNRYFREKADKEKRELEKKMDERVKADEQSRLKAEEESCLYLMRHSNGLTKIGRSVKPKAREKTLQAEDPRLRMIFCVNSIGVYEKRLHQIFADLRKRGEWFDLDDHHVEWIKFFFCGFSA
jgi:hypothetical protein